MTMTDPLESVHQSMHPVKLTIDQVKAASEGRAEEVLAGLLPHKPVSMTKEEVRAAGEGKAEEIMRKKLEPRKK
jgi:hypothetical protein